MTKVFDEAHLARAAAEAERALAAREPDVLAGRFSPHPLKPETETRRREPATAAAERGRKRAG